MLNNQDGQVVSGINSQTRVGASEESGVLQNNIVSESQIYRTLQPGQNIDDKDNSTNSTFDASMDKVRGEISQTESTTDIKGETFVPEATYTGVTGQKQVNPTESFGVVGQTEVSLSENFGVTGEKRVLESSLSGVKGETSVSIDDEPLINSNDFDQPNITNDSIYKQVGPDGQVITSDSENQNLNSNLISESNNGFTDQKTNRLTFDKMSSVDSMLESEESQASVSINESDLGNNNIGGDKAIYGSLPNQEIINLGTADNSLTPSDRQNLSSDQKSGTSNDSATTTKSFEGASGDKTVNIKEYSSARGEESVISREFSGTKGESSVNYSDARGVSGTTGVNNFTNNQQSSVTSDGTRKLIINKTGANNNQFQDNLGQTTDVEGSAYSSTSLANTTDSQSVNISNENRNASNYEDTQTESTRRQLDQQGQEFISKEATPQRPIYKTITDNSGNTYEVDEYGNKINDSDFSYETENNSNARTPRYSVNEDIGAIEVNDGQGGVETNQALTQADSAKTYQTNMFDRANQNKTVNQVANQTQSFYSPLTGNASRLTKSEGPGQRATKNYNFIQKLSMTINRALGIEPQSVKDEINLNNLDDQELSQGAGSTRIVSPRVTGLLESETPEDEEEERKNRRKKLRYQRVGYIEPDLKAPEPIKLDDETQAFQDLYGERNRFDSTTSETNSALLRMAEEEIEKQSEAAKEANVQEPQNIQPEINQDIESIYYVELLKERSRLEQALDEERESNRLAIRKSEDNIQQQLLDLILNNQNADIDSRSDDPINQIVQSLIADDKNKNSEQVIIDATRIVQMIQNQITESNGKPIDEYLLRKRIEEELKSEFVYMQKEQEKKMKLVYKKMLEDMYMDMINN